jgi:hypothetical protein
LKDSRSVRQPRPSVPGQQPDRRPLDADDRLLEPFSRGSWHQGKFSGLLLSVFS